jgi:hypothetical protein
MAAKSIELLHELIPSVAVIALLVDQAYPGETRAQVEEAQNAARVLGVRLLVLEHFPKRMNRAGFPCGHESDSRIVLEGGPV